MQLAIGGKRRWRGGASVLLSHSKFGRRNTSPRPSHEPGNAHGAVGSRFVPNRSADVGTGAEPTHTRGLAEHCELGQLALRHQGRFMAGEQARKEQATSHEPGNADGAVGPRFVPNRSADVGTGAEPTHTRGLAEHCELGQLALRHLGRFMAGEQVRKEQATFHETGNVTVQSDRGLSQTATRMLAGALNLPRRAAWRSAASWDNSRSWAKEVSGAQCANRSGESLPILLRGLRETRGGRKRCRVLRHLTTSSSRRLGLLRWHHISGYVCKIVQQVGKRKRNFRRRFGRPGVWHCSSGAV